MNTISTGNSIADSLVAAIIFQLLYALFSVLYLKWKKGFFKHTLTLSSNTVLAWWTPTCILITGVLFYLGKIDSSVFIALTIYSLSVSFFIFSRKLRHFKKAGILGIDLQIQNGIDYKKALKLTKRNLKVLGTGGDKLTSNDSEFLRAIKSATDNSPAQLLLCHPNSEALRLMAKKNHRDELEYVQNVKRSLKRLKRFIDNGANIELRLYKSEIISEMPTFRLMFFNNHFCLCSYNVFGNEDKGQSAPQLHLYCPVNSDGTDSYYKAFEMHYENVWKLNQNNIVDWDKLDL